MIPAFNHSIHAWSMDFPGREKLTVTPLKQAYKSTSFTNPGPWPVPGSCVGSRTPANARFTISAQGVLP